MALLFLDFDQSEDAHDTFAWHALASPAPVHKPAMLAEVARLLERLHVLHGPPGPLDHGHAWDCDLQVHHDDGAALPWHWLGQQLQWSAEPQPGSVPAPTQTRLTLSLVLTGGTEFKHSLEQAITPA